MPAAAIQRQIDKVYAIQQHSEFGAARNAFLFLPGEYKVDVPIGFYTEVAASAHRPTPSTSPATSTPTPACPTTTPPAPSGAASKASPSRPPAGRHRHHAMGRLPGRPLPPHAHPRQPRPPPESRLGQRRLDVRLPHRRQRRLRLAAAVDLPQQRVGQLDRLQLEHGLRRRPQPARRRLARAALHQGRPRPHRPRKALSLRRRARQLLRPRSRAPHQQRRHHLARRRNSRPHHPPRTASTSPIPATPPPHINAQLARRQESPLHPRHLRTDRAHPRHPSQHRCSRPRLRHAPTHQRHRRDHHRRRRRHHPRGTAHRCGPRPVRLSCCQIGPEGSHANHAQNPISLHDIFFRVGGAGVGRATVNLANQHQRHHHRSHLDLARRSRHAGVGWDQNLSANGLVVNGNNVTAYGLFVEHHQQFRSYGTATPAALTSINPKFPTIHPTRPATPAPPAPTAGPPTRSPTASPRTKPGASASIPSSAIPTSCSPAPSKSRKFPAFVSIT